MRTDTIPKIENFITDVLLSSKYIPLGVNVMRLAAVQDEEGMTAMARSIAIRYVNSTISVEQKTPIVITRTMTFEVIISAQSYLTESGHDYALQMCSGAYLSLNNQVPINAGVQILMPMCMKSESFDGLTDSSHYVYTQTWEIEVQEINSLVSLDPCVMRGNCSYLFPETSTMPIKPGDIIEGNDIYVPIRPPVIGGPGTPEGGAGGGNNGGEEPPPWNPEECGVIERDGDLYFEHDPDRVFLENWEGYVLTSSGQFDTTGTLLICNIHKLEDGSYVGWFFAANCDGRKVIQIGGFQPGSRRQLGGLIRSEIGYVSNLDHSGPPEPFNAQIALRNGFGFVVSGRARIFTDPTNTDAPTSQVKYGMVFTTQVGTKLTVPAGTGVNQTEEDMTYSYIGGTRLGKAWINDLDFKNLDPETYLPEVICEDVSIEGPVDQCD
jgi:hypothetical protein